MREDQALQAGLFRERLQRGLARATLCELKIGQASQLTWRSHTMFSHVGVLVTYGVAVGRSSQA